MIKSVILAGLVLGVTILSSIAVDNAFANIDTFLVIKGVEGESEKPGHEGEVDVLDLSWGFSTSGSAHGGGAGSGKVEIQEMTIEKQTDSATVPLLRSCCQDSIIDEIKIVFFDSTKSDTIPYLEWQLKNAQVTSYQTSGASGDDVPTENLAINFEEIKVTYTKLDMEGPESQSVTIAKRPTRA